MEILRKQLRKDLGLLENELKTMIYESKEEYIEIVKRIIRDVAMKPIKVEAIKVSDASIELWVLYSKVLAARFQENEEVFKEVTQNTNKAIIHHCDKLFAQLLNELMDYDLEKHQKEVALTGELRVTLDTAFTSNLLNTSAVLLAAMSYGVIENEQSLYVIQQMFDEHYLNSRTDLSYVKAYLM